MTDQRGFDQAFSPNFMVGHDFYLSAVQAASEAFMADRSKTATTDPSVDAEEPAGLPMPAPAGPMQVYVDGMKYAEFSRRVEGEIAAAGKPPQGDPMAHAYCRGFFACLDELGAKIFRSQLGPHPAKDAAEERISEILAEIEAAAKASTELQAELP